ncbi:hypothetical protein C7S18_14770 [Ahniella affigens]|uniref:Uncharacterized protein n=1 Tax=Ahniella affigens TaxID=2021234 RepID=A0A2P1PU63_9GAMM|nr:hypothetical protein [Ahniella affigens]AVP98371.1 hypothetical protein C7S18_14770 [Ahniella affigens]
MMDPWVTGHGGNAFSPVVRDFQQARLLKSATLEVNMPLRIALFVFLFLLLPLAHAAERVERRVEVLATTRIAEANSELRFESGSVLAVPLDRIEIIDLQHPARPPRRSLKLAPAGSGVVLDLRHDETGALRFGRVFLTRDRASAEAFLAQEFRRDQVTQESP